jgi:hypothetical protein
MMMFELQNIYIYIYNAEIDGKVTMFYVHTGILKKVVCPEGGGLVFVRRN